VLENDGFDSVSAVEVTSVTSPAHGTVIINNDNTLTYVADEGFYGEDIFEYTVTITNQDGSTSTETAYVYVTVFLTPFAIADEFGIDVNIPEVVSVLDNDYDLDGNLDPTTLTIVLEPLNGEVVINADGTITYTPNFDFIGEDTFEYQICDNDGFCDTAMVEIFVRGVKGAEVRIPQGFSPNGDGVHDLFVIGDLANYYPNFRLQVFNRWGNVVYDYKHDGNPLSEPIWWDGYSSGRMTIDKNKELPVGTYFYVLDYNKQGITPRTGYVYLNR